MSYREYRVPLFDPKERREGARWLVVVIAVLVVLLVLGGVLWGVGVLGSGAKGQGDAYREKNSAENWTKAQADFNRRYQSIKALDKNITIAAGALERHPDDQRREIEYDGLVRNCNDAVAGYNTAARSYLSEQFRDADLPSEIDNTDPSTDCKEN